MRGELFEENEIIDEIEEIDEIEDTEDDNVNKETINEQESSI